MPWAEMARGVQVCGIMKLLTPFKWLTILLALATLPLSPRLYADDPAAVDNSGKNVTDRDDKSVTPIDQAEDSADIKMTAHIRRAIVRDSSLSVDAHNVKIITTKDHVIYLRGPVATDEECQKVESIAKMKAGDYTVKNEMKSKTTGH